MLNKLNHKAKQIYQTKFNANVSEVKNYKEHGVTVVFIKLKNTKIELMQPYGNNSPIQNFLDKHPDGGIHHICIEVDDIEKSHKLLKEKNVRILGNDKPVIGSHNKPILFLHPKDFCGTLIELEEK